MARGHTVVSLSAAVGAARPVRVRPAPASSGRGEVAGIGARLAGTLGASVVIAALGVVSGAVAARALGPEGRGELAQFVLWPQIVAALGILGLDLAATHLSADGRRRADVPATVLVLAAAEGLLLVPVYVALVPLLFPAGERSGALLTLPTIHGLIIGGCGAACLSGRLRFAAFNATRVAAPALYCAGIVALWQAGALTPRTAALAFVLATAAADGLIVLLIWRAFGFGRFDTSVSREALSYGARGHFGRLTPQLLSADMMVVALLLSSHDVGIFVVATSFLAAPAMLTGAVGMVVFPHVSSRHLAGERVHVRATFLAQAGAVTLLAIALAVSARPAIVALFGEEYASGATVLRLLAVGSVALSVRSFLGDVLRGLGRPGLASVAEIANWALFLTGAAAGARAGGLAGTALGVTAASYASLAVLCALAWRTRAFSAARVL